MTTISVVAPSETIGQRVKRLRLANGWSQDELGKLSSVDGSYVSKLEHNHYLVNGPGAAQCDRLAAAFGVSLDYLINGRAESKETDDEDKVILDQLRNLPAGDKRIIVGAIHMMRDRQAQLQAHPQ